MGRTTAQRRSHARGSLLPARLHAEAWGGAIQWGQRFPSGLTCWADTEECWQAQEQSKFHPCFLSAQSPKPLDAYEPLFSNLIQGHNSACFRASVRQDVSRYPLRSLKQTSVPFACVSAARILCSHGMSSKVTLSLSLYLKPRLLAPRMQGLCLPHFAGHVTGWVNVCWLPMESTPLLPSPTNCWRFYSSSCPCPFPVLSITGSGYQMTTVCLKLRSRAIMALLTLCLLLHRFW